MTQINRNILYDNHPFPNIDLVVEDIKKDDQILNELKIIANSHDCICLIIDIENFEFVHINPIAEHYFKYKNEELSKLTISDIFKSLHPYNFHIIKSHICYFTQKDNANKEMSYVYYLETTKGWQWIHSVTSVVNYTKTGYPKYLLLTGTNITEILNGDGKFRKIEKDIAFIEENKDKFKLLTKREIEILTLIVQEKTSIEIGKSMHISSKTVDTHRNKILCFFSKICSGI